MMQIRSCSKLILEHRSTICWLRKFIKALTAEQLVKILIVHLVNKRKSIKNCVTAIPTILITKNYVTRKIINTRC